MRSGLRVHFLHQNVRDIVVILEEGNPPHPQFPRCDIMVPWSALNGHHPNISQCAKGAERKWKRCGLAAEEMREITERDFQAYGRPLILA